MNRHGCISYKDLIPGHNYTLVVFGENNSTGDNRCKYDEIQYTFTAPAIPPRTKFGDPCQWAKVEPSPNPVIKGDNMRIKVTSNAFAGKMDVKFINVLSGSVINIESNLNFLANEEVEINYNTANLPAGTYKIWAESEGDLVEATVIIME